jgi:hypothetical protein
VDYLQKVKEGIGVKLVVLSEELFTFDIDCTKKNRNTDAILIF